MKDKNIEKLIDILAIDEAQHKLTQSHSLKVTIPVNGQYDSQTFFQSCDVIVKKGKSLEEASEKAYQWCRKQNINRYKEALTAVKVK